MYYIVDLQGFQQPQNKFVLKELAVLSLYDSHYVIQLFEPPYEWTQLSAKYKSCNAWLTRNFHGLNWQDGHIPYNMRKSVIKSTLHDARIVYVKGKEKKDYLSKYLNNSILIIDLNDIDCPSLRTMYKDNYNNITCPHHTQLDDKISCALKNVNSLRYWMYPSKTY